MATGLFVTQTLLLELLLLVMKMLSGHWFKSDQRNGTRHHYFKAYSPKQPTIKEMLFHPRGLDAQPHRAPVSLSPAPSKVCAGPIRNPDLGSLRSMSLPPLIGDRRPRQ
ncbi:hypothetical protein FRC01_007977 [Tulasnella sp. 417]|nr:hypothetical protein FRC01_007977 [Tulasnella sp. 417]